jgi:uncharacterized membrane protein
MERRLALCLTSAAVLWTAAIFFAPLEHQRHAGLAVSRATQAVRAAGALVCHQRVARSFAIGGHPMPVCARCTGLYVSGAAGALVAWLGLPLVPRRTRAVILVAAVPTLATIAVEWAGLGQPGNPARAMAALPLGGACGWMFIRMLRAEAAPTTWAMIS